MQLSMNKGLFWLCLLAHLARCGEAFLFFRNDVKVTNEGTEESIPVSITDATVTLGVSATTPLPIEQRTPLAISGEWTSAGLAITPSTFIIHDLFFFVESDSSPPCEYSMNFVIDSVSMKQKVKLHEVR